MAKKKPRRRALYLLFRLISFFIYLLPMRVGLKIGEGVGRIVFYILKRERKRALDNLDIAFGNSKSLEEKKIIVKRLFENLGRSCVEIVILPRFNSTNIDGYIECNGLDIIRRLISEGKGGIVLSAHLGNWELLAHYFAIKGFSVNVIARRVRMEELEKFLDRIRRRHGVNILHRDASIKEVIALLKNNEFVGMMPDQDMKSVSGVFVDFFGREAYTPNGPAVLNILTRSPIVPCFIVRKKFGHKILIEEPVRLSSSQDRDKDILENTKRCTEVIENYIRRFPSQWVWFHERWKTKKGNEA